MLRLRVIAKVAGWLALAVCLGGCIPADNPGDEEKDPHFQRGRTLVTSQDYKGAVEEFEKALETDPHSAAAHFELGWLYDTKLGDDAAAIYHYQRHLQLKPDSDRAQLVRQRIQGCKQDLAKSEFPMPGAQNLQREVDRLTAENLALKQQLDALRHSAAAIEKSERRESLTNSASAAVMTPAETRANAHPHIHVVKEHETVTSIAARYGLKAGAVLAANPRVDPRRLRIGQSLNLP
jgi:LysM repeat protein